MKKAIVHTTVHLCTNDAMHLNEGAEKLKMTRSQLMAILLKKMLIHIKDFKNTFTTVKYQKACDDQGWQVIHVFPEKVDYEVFTDMRNVCKLSVSFLLAIAIKKYLNQLLDLEKYTVKDEFDNYKIHDYDCTGKIDKNNYCWHTIWVLDKKLAQKLSR